MRLAGWLFTPGYRVLKLALAAAVLVAGLNLGNIVAGFAADLRDPRGPYSSAWPHQGIDIFSQAEAGVTPVYAAYDGYVMRELDWRSTLIILMSWNLATPLTHRRTLVWPCTTSARP